MKTIEDFFKNRVINKFDDKVIPGFDNHNFRLKCDYEYNSKEINPLSLNITNSIDLIEKLKPLLYFKVSYLEKFKNVNNHTSHDTLEIKGFPVVTAVFPIGKTCLKLNLSLVI